MKSVRPVRVRGVLAALVLGATVVAACGGNSPSSSTEAGGTTASTDAPVLTNAPTTTNPALVPVQGGTLTVALADESPGFNPTVDPWGFGGSLEWATSCPPPRHNFVTLPRIRSERPAIDLRFPELRKDH